MKPTYHTLGQCEYHDIHLKMVEFTNQRSSNTIDEVWFVEHEPVFTLGRKGSRNNVLVDSEIPFANSDRGGDITYHGPGQLIVYCLFDIKRMQLGVKSLVSGLEEIFIQYLSGFGIVGHRIASAPGVYVENRKIASLGLRVRNGRSFHGMAINVDMDLKPFTFINPCGLKGMEVTQLKELGIQKNCDEVSIEISGLINKQFFI